MLHVYRALLTYVPGKTFRLHVTGAIKQLRVGAAQRYASLVKISSVLRAELNPCRRLGPDGTLRIL